MISDIQILKATESNRMTFDWGELTWFATRHLGNSTDQTVGRCVLFPGMSNPRHYHPNCSEVLVVIHGKIQHTAANGSQIELVEGDTVTIPANIRHFATNLGTDNAILFITFSSADRETVGE